MGRQAVTKQLLQENGHSCARSAHGMCFQWRVDAPWVVIKFGCCHAPCFRDSCGYSCKDANTKADSPAAVAPDQKKQSRILGFWTKVLEIAVPQTHSEFTDVHLKERECRMNGTNTESPRHKDHHYFGRRRGDLSCKLQRCDPKKRHQGCPAKKYHVHCG